MLSALFDIDSVVVYQVYIFWHLVLPMHCCLCCFSFVVFRGGVFCSLRWNVVFTYRRSFVWLISSSVSFLFFFLVVYWVQFAPRSVCVGTFIYIKLFIKRLRCVSASYVRPYSRITCK